MPRKHRRNFFPAFIITILLWLILAFIIFETPPIIENIILFSGIFPLSLTLTLALLLGNTRQGFLIAMATIGILLLKTLI